MSKLFFPHEQVAARAAERPGSYLSELESCVVARSDSGIWVDDDSEAWKAMFKKYAPARIEDATEKPLPRAEWSLAVRAVARLANSHDRGVGDTIARLAGAAGGEAFKAMFARITGADCGCGDRQEKFNARYPYEITRP